MRDLWLGSDLDPDRIYTIFGSDPTWIHLDPAQLEFLLGPGSGLVVSGRKIAGSDLDPTWIQRNWSAFLDLNPALWCLAV